jgi:hypothetical protein
MEMIDLFQVHENNHKLSSVVKSIIVFYRSKAITIGYYFIAEFTKMYQNDQEIAV